MVNYTVCKLFTITLLPTFTITLLPRASNLEIYCWPEHRERVNRPRAKDQRSWQEGIPGHFYFATITIIFLESKMHEVPPHNCIQLDKSTSPGVDKVISTWVMRWPTEFLGKSSLLWQIVIKDDFITLHTTEGRKNQVQMFWNAPKNNFKHRF